jgi:ribonuclease P protein component
VLPAAARLRRREDFALVVRRGRRVGRGTLVVHYLPAPILAVPVAGGADAPPAPDTPEPPRRGVHPTVGFVVGRAVGGSVERHRVVRRLRALMRARLTRLPAGSRLVVRALPAARDADSAQLGADLDAALDRLVGPQPTGAGTGTVSPAAARSAVAAKSAVATSAVAG